jgi:hypothetical protein
MDFHEFLTSDELLSFVPNIDTWLKIEEIYAIYNGMDISDYTHMGAPRYLDLQSLLNQIYSIKEENPNKKLKKVTIIRILESFPPRNIYKLDL